ncbi:MAG: YHS domain-containing (seleno)protein [Cyanobacteria bacterium P01_A01_bin.135]
MSFLQNSSPALVAVLVGIAVGCSAPAPRATQEATPDTTAAAPTATLEAEETEDAVEATSVQADASSATAPAAVFAEDGVAIRGADPVAYFTQGEYVSGSANYTYDWGGATWQFASAENRDLFASSPNEYAPQYGGFCAWAVSEGYTAPVDPTAWEIVDGKLYLNFDQRIQRRWQRDIPGHIARADQNWPSVLNN